MENDELNNIDISINQDLDNILNDNIELDLEEINIEEKKFEQVSESGQDTQVLQDVAVENEKNIVLDLNIVKDENEELPLDGETESLEESYDLDSFFNSLDTEENIETDSSQEKEEQPEKEVVVEESQSVEEISQVNEEESQEIVPPFEEIKEEKEEVQVDLQPTPKEENQQPQLPLSDIKDFVNSKLGDWEEKFSDLTINTNSEIGKELIKIDSKLQSLSELVGNFSESFDAVKFTQMISDIREQLTLQMVQLFEGLSLNEDFEDLKNFIDEKLSSIHSEQNNFVDEKISTISAPASSSDVTESYIDELRNEIVNLKNVLWEKLNDIEAHEIFDSTALLPVKEQKTEEKKGEENSYGFVDAESDFAKLRSSVNDVIESLSEIKRKLEENSSTSMMMEGVSDDISSISKRTNKLILTSEDSHKTIKHYLEEFEKTVSEIQKVSVTLTTYPQQIIALNSKAETLQQMILNVGKSNKSINEALIYLAQWVDNASRSFEFIKRDLAFIKNDKFSQIALKEKSFDERFQSLTATFEEYNKSNKEIKSLLENLADKLSSTDTGMKRAFAIEDKLDVIEHKLSKLEKSISKITSYIEE